MTRSKLWVLAGLPFLLAGCGGDDAADEGDDFGMTDTAAAPSAAPMPMDTGMGGGMAGGMATNVPMQALRNSGVTGEATLTPQGQQLQVMVRLTGLPQGQQGEHPGHIHSGTCESPGGVVAPLQPITAGADRSGTMTTTVSVDPNTVMNGQHIVQYHQAGGGPGIVCGAVPQHQM